MLMSAGHTAMRRMWNGLIFINTEEELISGDFAKVKITGALEYDLIGELL